jgi:hypothetical protein
VDPTSVSFLPHSSLNRVLILCVIANRFLAQLATADPTTRSCTPIMEYPSRTPQHQIRKESRSMLPLYKVSLDSTDQSYVPPIWFHHHRCVHTHFTLYIMILLPRLLRLSSDGVLGFFSFTPSHLHTHLASCLFLFVTIPHDAHVESDSVYRLFLLATP